MKLLATETFKNQEIICRVSLEINFSSQNVQEMMIFSAYGLDHKKVCYR